MRAECAECGVSFDERQPGTWREVTGWVVERRAGGANSVRSKTETGRVICPPCGLDRDRKIDREQGALFDG